MPPRKVTENPPPVLAESDTSAQTDLGYQVETQIDHRAESVRRASLADWQARQSPGEYMRLGNGAVVKVQPGIAPHYDTNAEERKEAEMLGRCDELIHERFRKGPFIAGDGSKLGERYRWLVFKSLDPKDNRPAETANWHKGSRIRYVEADEIDTNCSFAVYTEHPAGDRTYVTHMSMILAEILDPRIAYMRGKAMEDKALDRLKAAPRDVPNSATLGDGLVTSVPGKGGTKYTEFAGSPRMGS